MMDISLIVGSCDKYEFIWDKFFTLFDKYWDHTINIDKYFLTQYKPAQNKYFIPLCLKDDIWTVFARSALDHIKTKYVLWMQDDYFLRKTISRERFEEYYAFIQKNNVERFGIHDNSYLYTYADLGNGYQRFAQNSLYTISMQASIWETEFLKWCLDQNAETNWQFEIDGSQRLNSRPHNIYAQFQNPSWYLEALKQGKYTEDYHNICKEEKL